MPTLNSNIQLLFNEDTYNHVLKGILLDFNNIIHSDDVSLADLRATAFSYIDDLLVYSKIKQLLSDEYLVSFEQSFIDFLDYYINSRIDMLTTQPASEDTIEKAAIASALTFLLEEKGELKPIFSGFDVHGTPIDDFGLAVLKIASFIVRDYYISANNYDFGIFDYFNQRIQIPHPNQIEAIKTLLSVFILTRPWITSDMYQEKNYANPYIKLILKIVSYTIPNLDIREKEALLIADKAEDDAYTVLTMVLDELRKISLELENSLNGEGYKNQTAKYALYLGNKMRYLSREEVALEGHFHSEYLHKDEPAVQARYLVDMQTGKRYTRKDFAKKDHKHPEYLQWNNIQSADFLITDSNKLLIPDDLALANHTHDYYKTLEEVPMAKVLTCELTQTYPIVPREHKHDGTYLNRLLHKNEIAKKTKSISNVSVNELAQANHTHNEYLSIEEAESEFEKIDDPNDPNKGAKGFALYNRQEDNLKSQTSHTLYGTLTVVGQAEVRIQNCKEVQFVFLNVISGDEKASMPTWEPIVSITESGDVEHLGVRFISSTNGRTTVKYFIMYKPK